MQGLNASPTLRSFINSPDTAITLFAREFSLHHANVTY